MSAPTFAARVIRPPPTVIAVLACLKEGVTRSRGTAIALPLAGSRGRPRAGGKHGRWSDRAVAEAQGR